MKYVQCKYRYQAKKMCTWASFFMKVVGGYACFESYDDYRIAKNQK
jgi:hypothetical protein